MLERKSPVHVMSAREMASLVDYFSRVIDPRKVRRRRLSDLWRDPQKAPAQSNGQTQEEKENVQVAPHVPADSEEPTNVKSIRCQCTVKQKKHSVLYHTLCPTD